MKPCTPPAKKPRLFRVAYLSLIWLAVTICALLFTAYPANASLMLNTSGDQNYTRGIAINDLQLPEATGGTGTLTYTLTGPGGGALSAGLTFDPETRTLSGTPSQPGATTLTYKVTDTSDAGTVTTSTSTTFTVRVHMLNTPSQQIHVLNRAITLQLPEAAGGKGPLVYTLTGPGDSALPAGLTFDPDTRTLSGTPSTRGTTTLTYRVTDANNASTSVKFQFFVRDSVKLTAPPNQNYVQGTAIPDLRLPAGRGGTRTLVYTLTGVPPGLEFDAGTRTRRLSGTPSALGSTLLTYTVTDANGDETSVTFTVTVNADLALNARGDQIYSQGRTIRDLELPEAIGGTGTLVYTLTGPSGLPRGLDFDPVTRTLSGTPSTRGVTTLTYTVTDINDASTDVTFTVDVRFSRAGNLRIVETDGLAYAQGRAFTRQLSEARGGIGTLTYTLTGPGGGPLPAGLTFDPDTRTLSGTPSTVGVTTLTYTVTDTNDTIQVFGRGILISVFSNLRLNTSGNRGYTQNTLITDLQLPEATGGFGTLRYTLTGPDGLPMGLTFDAGTRTLSGTPSTVGVTTLTYTVTDINDAFTAMFSRRFTVTVNAGLALNASGDQNYTQGTAITDLQLPVATGGTGTLQYTLTAPGGGLPAGLTFNASTRTLSGTPSRVGVTTLTYMATDINGARKVTFSTTFTVKVNASLALSASGDQNYTLDTAITGLPLPAATGGTGTLTYTLTSVPGLTFTPGTRTLSGTPSTADTFDLTYRVTDTNGASTSVDFMVTVNAGLALTAPVDQNYTQGTAITALTLPVATGGTEPLTYTLTGPGDSALPGGLTFSGRTLSGTPDTAATTILTYTVTDTNNANTSVDFTVTVNAGLALTASDNQNYTEDTAIPDLQLPVATGGTGTLTYTLTSVPGLTFTPGTRTLSGTPSTADTTVLTYTVTDTNNASTTATFTVSVSDGLALSARGDQNYTEDTAIPDLQLPVATGGTGTLTYTLTSVPGLTFTPGTRTLSGTPITPDTTLLTYTVTDTNNASTTATFTVIVSDGLAPLTAPNDQNYTQGKAITGLPLPEATGGTAPLTYSLTGLPVGLIFTASTRTLSGTPITPDTTLLTYKVTDANNASTNVTFMVTVNDRLALFAVQLNYTQGTAIDDLPLPEATGGTAPLTYTLTGVPPGLEFDAGTRRLSGTPGTFGALNDQFRMLGSTGLFTLTYAVTDANDATTFTTFPISIRTSLTLTAPDDQSYTEGTVITLQLPEASGGYGPLVYTLTSVPGLTFAPNTRTLSGRPSTPDTTTLTYTVMDANNASTSVDFTVTGPAELGLDPPTNQNYTQGTAITGLTLPEATSGTEPLTYTLTGPGGSLPGGLTFTASTRTLSGTPSTAGTTTLTYEVMDANGASTTATFMVAVNSSLALSTRGNRNYTQGRAITHLPLLPAIGGTGTLTYTLTGPGGLPAGLTFAPQTRTLSGTPSTAATTTLTYTVTDANGASTNTPFTVMVNPGLAPLTAPNDQNYTQGRAITHLPLPEATGGTAPLMYTLTGPSDSALPMGLTFNPDTRILSGTPDTAGDFTLTYEVTDTNGASKSVTFMVTVNDDELGLNVRGDQNYTQGRAITDLTLPEATGGMEPLTYTLTGPSGGNLPAGLSFNASTRTLSGTPSTPATTTLTYEVTDALGTMIPTQFMVTVNAELALSTRGNQNYTQGTAINNLQLPEASGGTGTLVYTLTSVPGLDFNADTRTLSGTPSTPGTFDLTYTVTDDNGASTSVDFMVEVKSSLALSTRGNRSYTQGIEITGLELPEATGRTVPVVYTLTGPSDSALPMGLDFNADTRILSGTPSALGSTILTYTVIETRNTRLTKVSRTFRVTVTVNPNLALLTAPDDQNYTQGRAITVQLLPAIGGTGTLTYTLTGPGDSALPAGLSFNANTRMLSGTPSALGSTLLTYRVSYANNASTDATFTVTVNPGLAPLTAPDDQNYTLDTAITNLTLPEADGGTGTLTYTLTGPGDSPLPGGLTFSGRTLSGTPSTAGTTTLTYRVTDANGASTTATFMVIVSDGLALSARGDQNYTFDTEITALELPVATGGTGTLTYTLTSVPGLNFNANTRTLSGTPSTADTFDLTYTVTDANDASTTATFTIIVSDGLALDTPANQNYTEDKAITALELPEADGGTGTLTYTLTGPGDSPLPGGLTFSGRTLSGTPDTAATTILTYTVTDDNGATTSVDFTVSVSDSLTLNARGDQNYTLNTAITALELPVATGGTMPLTYTLTSVPGLNFAADTRTLSGTPSTPATTTLTYTVTDDNGASTTATFTIIVSDGLALTAPVDQNYTLNTAITALELPEADGGTGTLTYTLTGPGDSALPGGLTFSGRTLSGTPDTADTTVLTYTVTDDNGATTSVDFTVTVNDGLALSARGDQNYTQDKAITDLELPIASGGTAPLTYTLTSVPGLDFDPGTRTLSGTPTEVGTTTLTYEVMDENGASTSVDFTVTVNAGLALSARGDQNYTEDTAITALELPEADGGTGTLTYTLTGPGDSALPGGLTFSGRTLSGTPDTADTTVLTYTVTDDNGATTSVDFTVTVNDGLALSARGDQNYTQDKAITDLELPIASGGTAPLTYTLTSVPGLDFDPGTRTLSGTPTEVGTTTLTYEVMDENGASTSVDFTVTVNAGLALSARGDQNYTEDTAIPDLELPEASGGTEPLTYTLTSVPGLDFDADTRILSGTPSTPDTTTLTYMVSDANGASTTATFTVIVSDGLALTASGNQNYTQDKAIPDLQLPIATGGTGTLTYTLTGPSGGNLPAGLTFSGRTLSGTPTEVGTTTLTYEVMDENGASTSVDFTVTVNAGLALSARGDQNYTLDTEITGLTLPEADGGTAPLTYTLTSVPGLDFDADTRILSGTPSTPATTTLTYMVSDANGASTTATFTVIVSDGLALTASGNQNYTQDKAIPDLQLPIATGGTGTLTYTLTGPSGGNLPAGLTFSGRTLSGTPDTAGNFTLTYTVTDTNGASTSVDFMVTVNAGLTLDTPGNQNYTEGRVITDLELPIASGGTAPLTYTLTSVPGLDFNANTRILSGTPSTADTFDLTYEVTDDNGADESVTFTVSVSDSLTLSARGDQNYTQDKAITGLELPEADGGTGTLTYTLTGPGGLPGGLDFSGRTLSGTPDTADTTVLTYTVTDANGASKSVDFMVMVNASLALTTPANQNYTLDTEITDLELPEASGGTEPLTYTLTSVPGLDFDADTRILSGTPSTPATTTLTYTVSDANGASTSVDFMVIVSDGLALTTPANQNYTEDKAITELTLPEASGGTGTRTYTLTGPGDSALPGGLTFSGRTLSGTPDTAATTVLTYTVTDANGASKSVDFMVMVNASLALTTPANQNYTLDTEITALELPVATGGTEPLTYTLTSVPGLTFTPGTRILSGTPSMADTTTLTYTVTDTNGASTSVDFMVIVSDGLALTTPANQNYTEDKAITELTLPEASGGTGTRTYTLTGPGDSALPGGLTFSGRTLSGTPDTADTTVLTYTVTDANGASKSVDFMVMVNASLALTTPANQNYTLDTEITALELPVATGGTEPLTYTLTSVPGLTFTPGTRILSGTPSMADTTTLTYTVTDTNGASTTATFTIIVSDGLALDTPANQNYTEDKAITALELPEADGGTGTLTYTLTGPGDSPLPGGLTFSGRTLSGTPDTAATTILTYTVTDTNGANTSVDFTVSVSDGLALSARGDQNYTFDTEITALELPVATGGTGTLTYTLTSVPGLNFNANTRTLSGTPSTADTFDLTYTVTDANDASTTATFTIIVSDGLALDTPANQNYTEDKAITALELPEADGGTGTLTYTLTGPGDSPLPGGLTFSGRTLSGTPDTAATTILTYTVTDTNGANTSVDFTVSVSDGLALSARGDQNYTFDTEITALELPVATGGTGTLTYTLTSVPGLNFNANTRTLSGTPSTADTFDLTYTVTDANDASTTATFTIIVSDGLALDTPANQNYTEDKAITALELPEADGGTGTLTYTLTGPGDSPLPGGLTFSGRTLSGTPDTAATTILTYTVTDTNGANTSVDFTVSVSDGLALSARGDQNYTFDTEITALELPVATGGTGTLTYTLTSVPGLNFNANTRTLSGTPSTADTFDLTYTVTDANDASTTATFTIIVSDGLALDTPANQNYTEDKAITALELPEADGGTGTLTYTLTGPGDSPLPGGLTFSGRTLSGTPDTAATTILTYTVTDDNGATTSVDFTVSVSDSLTLNARGDQNYTLNTAITALELPVATGGTMPLTYTLTSVPGLNFAADTRTLSGTPSTPATTTLTYTVTDDNGASTTATFTIIVSDGLALTAPVDQNYTLNTAITALELPEADGGTGTLTYTLTGPGDSALPGGLTFSGRTLSGTPDTADTTVLTYTVTDDNGATTSVDFTVTVNDGLALSARGDQNYTQDKAITDLELPIASGGTAPLTYTLTSVPGLDFDPGTRTLSGTPSTPATTTLTYTVTDDNGASTTATFTIIVSDGLALTAPVDQNYTLNTAITALELPEADGGTGTLTYTLTGPGDSALPGGLTFSGRTLSGTPDTADTTVLTYTVTDDNGATTSVDFTVTVNDGLALSARGDQNYTQDKAITDLELPIASGGTAPLTYTLTSVPGLDFDPGTRTLSGTPTEVGTTTLTYEVMDENGASTSVDFTVTVNAGLALSARGDQNYTEDTAITALELPEADGGTEPLTYTLTSVPGLDFDADTRILSGTPSTPDTTTLTYMVSDANGASTTATFTVIVSDGLALTASGNQNYTQDKAIPDLQLPIATGGTGTLTYTLTGPSGGNLPAGLTFSGRTLSGTPTEVGTTTLTYEVMDENGASTSVDFTVTVNAGLALSARGDQNYTLDTEIPDLQLPIATGGTGTLTYTLTGPSGGNLPAGLTFSGRTLSGTPDTAGDFTLTYMVSDANGASTSVDFMVTVNAGLTLDTPGNQNYTEGRVITDLELPIASGGTAPLTYTLTSVPGLDFNANTRILSGTPSTADTFDLTYEVTDDNGADESVTFTVSVSDSLTLSARGDQNYTQDKAITGLELPEADGGTGTLTYTLTGPGGLPGGLDFSGRTLSGTPTEVGTTTLTYEVMDENGASTSVDFMVIVSDGLALTTPANQNYTEDKAITELTLPEASGGTGTRTYTLTGPGDSALPGGLTFSGRTLSGTPDTAATTVLTYTVTDANGASKSVDFMVMVNASLALTTPANQNYTLDTEITALELPVATGGTEPLTYTLTSVPGLTFTPGTRILSGTPSMADTTTLTYTVTDANGASTSVDFMVIVSDGLALTTPANQNYTEDKAITELTLPEASGGTGTRTYTLTGPGDSALPGGLTFSGRTLSGTPDTADTTVLTYTVTDANGASKSVDFMVMVNASLALTTPANQNYTLDTEITALELPVATGGTEPLTYTLTSVPGLTFTPGTRILSGTPSMADTTTLTYTVTDANGASTSVDFMVIVSDGLALTTPANQNYTEDKAITELTLPEASGGTGTRTYTLTGPGDSALPGGLNFNANTRTLSGTPSTADTTTLTYTVTDTNGASENATFTVTVNEGLALTASGNQNYTRGTAISNLILPAATGGTGTLTYTLTSVPGLDFNANTRTLSGTPSTAGTTTLTYRVSDTNGANTTATFTVMVNAGLALTASGNQNYTRGTAISNLILPAATGGTGTLTYTLTGPGDSALPGGLTFSGRTLSGTPDTADTTVLTYTVTDANNASTTATFTVIVSDGLALSARGDQNYTLDTEITGLELPVATGGTAPLTYTLTSVPGLTFSGRTLSGTPSTAGTTNLTYTVTDANGANTSVDFMVIVSDGLALTASGNQNYTEDRAISGLTLPEATGGTGTLTYTLTSVPGLDFNANTRILSGTPSTAGTTTLTYMVTDDNGASTSVDFMVTVNAGLTLDTPGNQNYTLDTAIPDLQLPAATGGTGTLTYTLTGPSGLPGGLTGSNDDTLPGGLTFTAGTHTLSGTPNTAGTTTLTYTVTSANGASTNATFTVTVSDNTDEGFADLNTVILPEMARAIADQKVSAITQRIAKTMSGGSTRSVTIAGHSTLAEAASAHGQAIADGTLSLKDLLNNSDFVLPLNDASGTDSGALWGGGSYRSFEGSGGEDVDFDGDLFSAYLGLDTQPRDDLLIGLTLSWSQSNLGYQRSELERKGDYKLDLTSINPYVGWEVLAGKLDLWATAGYGWGDLKITDDGSDQASSYVEAWDVAVGGNIQLSQATSPVLFRLKSSALLTEMDVEGSDDIAGLGVDASLLRMVLEGTDKHLLANGAYVEPSLEVGVRYNGGDGETGFEAELGAGFRYINPIAGLTLEGRARTLVGRDNYNAWGLSGLILLEQGSNGRGLSFSLSPGYGNTNSGTEKIWKDGLRDEISGDQGYSLRLDTRIGYGLTAPGVRGLLTPYSEMTFGGSDRSYRLGIRWELDSLFDLNLTGERIESNSSTADRAIDRAMLKGNIRF